MSTSAIKVNLTADKKTFLEDKSAYLFTVAFDGSTAYWSTIYDASTKAVGTSATIPLINSGKLYVIQTNADLAEIKKEIAKEADIAPANATTAAHQFRYDSFEYALDPGDEGGTPQGNLTSVNGFGFPMSLRVDYTNGESSMSAGYNVTGQTLLTDLHKAGSPLLHYGSGGLKGEFLYAGSPSTESQGEYVRPVEYSQAHWTTYLEQLGTHLQDNPVRIAGIFNGAPDASGEWHNQGFYNYVVSYVSSTHTYVLTPEANSQIKGTIKISSADLARNIYAIDATTSADIYSVIDGKEVLYTSEALGTNDQYGAIFTQFLTGLDLGYLGQAGKTPNSTSESVNLDYNWNWSPIYAFGSNLKAGSVTPTYDAYSKVLFDNSNSYGSQYSDNAMSQYAIGGPLLNLFETVNGVNQTVDADQITLTIFDDNETPTGYVEPKIYDYIAPPESTGYGTFPDMTDATFANFVVNVGIPAGTPVGDQSVPANRLGQTSWFADPSKFALSYQYLVDKNTWSKPAYVYSDAGKDSELWSQWSLSTAGGRATLTSGTSYGQQGVGNMLINNIPVSKTEGVVNWHRLTVYDKTVSDWESKGALKTFNVYTTANGSTGMYYLDGKLAVDGGAFFTTAASEDSGPSAKLNLSAGAGAYFDPDLLYAYPNVDQQFAMSGTVPAAPVVGSIDSKDKFTAADGQTSMISPGATVKGNNAAFGWTGLNPVAKENGQDAWITRYTNKVSAQHTVMVSWSLVTGKDQGTAGHVETIADIDGKWLTRPAYIAPGKYNVTMTEYAMVDGKSMQFAQTSNPLTLTVDGTGTAGQAMRDAYVVKGLSALSVGQNEGVLANDLGDPMKVSLVSAPNSGELSLNPDGSFTYTPDSGFVGLDYFEYMAHKEIGEQEIEYSVSTVKLQVVPQIGELAGSLGDYSTVGLGVYGYFGHGVGQALANEYLSLLDEFEQEGLSAQQSFYNLANVLGETDRARSLYPFLQNPTTDESDINAFLDTVYQVLFNRAPDDVGRAYWVDDIQKAIERGDDIDPYVFTIMNGAQEPDMTTLTGKSLIARETLFQQYQHDTNITDQSSGEILAGALPSNLLPSMVNVYNDAIV